MPRVISTLQAMSHPTVVETINCLSEMSQRLQDENDELRAALAQPEQGPVAWEQFHEHMAGSFYKPPPQRPWVGLTEVDILAASRHWRHAEDFMAGVYWAAGTLKEFNT